MIWRAWCVPEAVHDSFAVEGPEHVFVLPALEEPDDVAHKKNLLGIGV